MSGVIVADYRPEGITFYRSGQKISLQTAKLAARKGTPIIHVQPKKAWVQR